MEKALARDLTKHRQDPAPTDGALVSIVVTNRDGAGHLRHFLDGLRKRTRYRSIELVLVDNGSTDRSIELFNRWDGQKSLISNLENQSFSAANNQGIRAATGDLVLLANNDIEPIHPDWLGYMVQSLGEEVAAVGAMLVYPKRPKGLRTPEQPDLTVQHLGVHYEYGTKGVRAVNTGAGRDPLSIVAPGTREVPTATAACLLARRSDLLVTPFDETYWYGSEDWDLCLRLADLGKIIVDERAVLFHHEFGTQSLDDTWAQTRSRNHQWFNGLWGPALMRKVRSELTGPPVGWFFRGDQAPTLYLTPEAAAPKTSLARQLSEQARRAGWHVSEEEGKTCDVAMALSPPQDVHWFSSVDTSVALVLDQEEEWSRSGALDGASRIFVPNRVGEARVAASWGSGIAEVFEELGKVDRGEFYPLLEVMAPRTEAMRIGVSTCAPDWEKAQFWGDTHLARGLMRAFRRLGHEAAELIVEDWDKSKAASCDVVIHLRGLERRPVARGQWNLLWIISHPDRLEPGECDDYDLVASASHLFAEQLSDQLGRPVHFIPQATDADRFKVGPREAEYEAQVLYVGNARWPNRRAPRWLMRSGRPFQLYGKHWDDFPEAAFVRRDYIPNEDLATAYRSADVVVADHHGSMRTNGFLANRLFDVLASGGVVLSDDVVGLAEVFGDLIHTYSDQAELESQLRILLSDPVLRRRIASEGRQVVLAGHTLDHRARQWLDLLERL
jgi:GT2 family glycosyltransferase/glycosyltransferase involved in cell wall biosynthesis